MMIRKIVVLFLHLGILLANVEVQLASKFVWYKDPEAEEITALLMEEKRRGSRENGSP